MVPFTFPAWYSALDRRRFNQAVDRANALKTLPPNPSFIALGFVTNLDALQAAMIMLEVVASTLPRYRDHQAVKHLAAAADNLRDQVIAWVDSARWARDITLDEFDEMVRAELEEETEYWPRLLTILAEMRAAIVPPTVPTKAPSSRTRKTDLDVEHLKAAREHVVLPLLDEVGWTATKWAMESGLHPDVTLGYLAGTSTPRPSSKRRMTFVLMKALGRSTLKLPE